MLPTWSPLRLSIAGLVLRGSMRAIPSGPEIPNDLIFKAGYMVATFCVVTLFCLAIRDGSIYGARNASPMSC